KRRRPSGRGWELAIVRLHETALTDLVLFDSVADGNNAADNFMSRHNGGTAWKITLHPFENAFFDPGNDFRLPRMTMKLFEQFQVGETQADRFDFDENLVWPGSWHRLRWI